MILVTVGMHTAGFPRLIIEMDRLASQIDEEVVMQIGFTPYQPQWSRWFNFTTQEEMDTLIEQSHLIVSHAGAGSIIMALHHHKPLIVVPRRYKYGEHFDDHQLELAEVLAQTGSILVAYETKELSIRLEEARSFTPRIPLRSQLIGAVRNAISMGANRKR